MPVSVDIASRLTGDVGYEIGSKPRVVWRVEHDHPIDRVGGPELTRRVIRPDTISIVHPQEPVKSQLAEFTFELTLLSGSDTPLSSRKA